MKSNAETLKKLGEVMLRANAGDHFHVLGIHMDSVTDNGATMRLDYHNDIIGNPESGVVSGGSITALLDTCCGFVASSALDNIGLTPTIDLRIDYMGPAEVGKPIYAEAEVYRKTRYVMFLRGVAYQDKGKPIAHAVGNFMVMEDSGVFDNILDVAVDTFDQLPDDNHLESKEIELISSEVMLEMLHRSHQARDANLLIEAIPYTKLLGMRRISDRNTDKWLFHMPASPALIGNPTLPAIHGGAMGGFMESAAILHLIMKMDVEHVPKVVDFSIDYIRAGRFLDSYARCKIIRFGRKLVNLSVEAWQDDETKPVAKARLQVLID